MKQKPKIITLVCTLLIVLAIALRRCGTPNNDNSISTNTEQVDNIDIDNSSSYVLQPDTIRKITISIGDKPSVHGKVLLEGNNDFYNSRTHDPFGLRGENDITEPDWIIQLQYERWRNTYIGLHLNKEKFTSNKMRFGFGGPTDIGISIGKSFQFFDVKWLSINTSLATGTTIGVPRFTTPWWFKEYGTEQIYSSKIRVKNFEKIGYFATLVTRVDVSFKNRFNIFVAPTVNYRFIDDYNTNVGLQKTDNIYSIGLNIGAGINLNYNNKRRRYLNLNK